MKTTKIMKILNIFKYGLRAFISKKRSSISFMLITFGTCLAIMLCTVILGVCDIYRSKSENPYSDYYRMVVDNASDLRRETIESEGEQELIDRLIANSGYSDKNKMSVGGKSITDRILKYFKDITDWNAELSFHGFSPNIECINITPSHGSFTKDLFRIYGITDCMELREFVTGDLTLLEGRFLKKSDRTGKKNVCMISEDLAKLNSLKIGSEITIGLEREKINKEYGFPSYTLKVVGIYRINTVTSHESIGGSAGMPENLIFVPLSVFDNTTLPTCYNFQIKLRDESLIDELQEAVNKNNMANFKDAYFIKVSDIYESENKGIHALMDTFNAVQWVFIAIASLLVAIFISSLVRARKRELGTFLSLGYSKAKVAGIFSVELLTSAAIGTGAAMLISNFFGIPFANAVLKFATKGASAESLHNTTSDTLVSASLEAEALTDMISLSFIPDCMASCLAIMCIVIGIGLAVAIYKVLSLKVINLLTNSEDM